MRPGTLAAAALHVTTKALVRPAQIAHHAGMRGYRTAPAAGEHRHRHGD
jgi:hypothetical protein